jgi:hypothetical protein
MSVQCDIARLAIRKQALMRELDETRHEIKTQCRGIELPFAVEIDGMAVTVKPAQYHNTPPQTHVLPLHKGCET